MTALATHLRLVDFPSATPNHLQQQVTKAIDEANDFLDQLSASQDQDSTPISAKQALDDIMQFDHINLALDRSWGVLSHLNSVMSNDDIRHVHHELLPMLSAYGTRVGQHKPLFERYQAIVEDTELYSQLEPARTRAIALALQRFELSGVALPKAQQEQ